MKKTKHILTSGEFAKLCKTTKETLFHYDRENLLKPRYVSQNGYRRYGVEQFFDFDMISTLKDTGSSLKEIREYLHNSDVGEFLTLLEEKRRIVKKERAILARREKTLQDLAVHTREAMSFTYDTFMICEQEEERLEAVPTEGAPPDTAAELVQNFAEYIDFYARQKREPRQPFGSIILYDDRQEARYTESLFFSRATSATPRKLLHIKAAGRYAVIAHKGDIQTHMHTFNQLLQRISKEGLRMNGNAYIYDMMTYILLGVGKRYAAKYCIPVAPVE